MPGKLVEACRAQNILNQVGSNKTFDPASLCKLAGSNIGYDDDDHGDGDDDDDYLDYAANNDDEYDNDDDYHDDDDDFDIDDMTTNGAG